MEQAGLQELKHEVQKDPEYYMNGLQCVLGRAEKQECDDKLYDVIYKYYARCHDQLSTITKDWFVFPKGAAANKLKPPQWIQMKRHLANPTFGKFNSSVYRYFNILLIRTSFILAVNNNIRQDLRPYCTPPSPTILKYQRAEYGFGIVGSKYHQAKFHMKSREEFAYIHMENQQIWVIQVWIVDGFCFMFI